MTNAEQVIYTGPVAVGAPETPTPTGNYYLYVLLQAPNPGGPYGPFAYGLSSHSEALETFAGADAEINIDMGLQNVSHLKTGKTDVTFTPPAKDGPKGVAAPSAAPSARAGWIVKSLRSSDLGGGASKNGVSSIAVNTLSSTRAPAASTHRSTSLRRASPRS